MKTEIAELETAYILRTKKPTPIKKRLKISTLQLLRAQYRHNIITEEGYIAALKEHGF